MAQTVVVARRICDWALADQRRRARLEPMQPSKFIWMDGDLVPWEEATIHVLSHTLHYGSGVFEGIRAYHTPEGTAVFRLTRHIERLHRSAKAVGLPLEIPVVELVDACKQVVKVNELDSAYVRPISFYELGSIGLNPAGATVRTAIAAFGWGAYLGEEGLANGIRVRVSSWRRFSAASFIPTAKATGTYLNSTLAKVEAVQAGYDEAIMLNEDGQLAEGSGENIFVIRDGVVHTPPIGAGILDGITRHSIMTLLADEGVEVKETSMSRGDLYHADETFFTGTAAEVTPIREIDDRLVGDGKPGPITRRAQELFADAVHGKLSAYRDWLEYV